MQRVLEPEYMDSPSEAQSYAHMDHEEANHEVVSRFSTISTSKGILLDIGTGPGDIPILLAKTAPDLRVIGIDAAASMLAIARDRVSRAGVSEQVRLQRADAKVLPFADSIFDGVISNGMLHHIPDPVDLLREAHRVLRPDGALLVRDLCRPEKESDVQRLVDLYAAEAKEGQRAMFHASLCAALTLDEAKEASREAGMMNAVVSMSSDRHYCIEIAIP